MIRLKSVAKPVYLDGPAVQTVMEGNRASVSQGGSPTITSLWDNESVRVALDERHYRGKCCYTERRRDNKLERDVEHFRPKAKVTGENNHPGYWWLAYSWDNLLISSKVSNSIYKANHFPLLPGGVRARLETDSLDEEKPALINPALEDPAFFITFHWEKKGGRYFCKAISTFDDLEGRGRITVEVTGINRPELLGDEERAESGKLLEHLAIDALVVRRQMDRAENVGTQALFRTQFEQLKGDIQLETKPEKTYAGARRAFFSKFDLSDCIFQEG